MLVCDHSLCECIWNGNIQYFCMCARTGMKKKGNKKTITKPAVKGKAKKKRECQLQAYFPHCSFQEEKKHSHELNVCVLAAVASTLGVYSFLHTMRLTSSSTALSASNFQLWGSRGALKKKPTEWLPQCQLKAVSSGLGGWLVTLGESAARHRRDDFCLPLC